jgi:SAM-dependent methyltransferase
MTTLRQGTPETRDFYDRTGWQRLEGELADTRMFGWTEGPIRRDLEQRRHARVLQLVDGLPAARVAELGCGGTPAVFLAKRCGFYTAVDFSSVGLAEASAALKRESVPSETIEADITDLPFDDGAFDAVYSAHVIYHIDKAEGQKAAFREAMRVVRPGGRAMFVLANPFPLLFPYRLLRRVLAMTPLVSTILNRLRRRPPLPYLPMSLGWMKRQLMSSGKVEITGYAISSVAFDRRVSETSALGRCLWQCIRWMEKQHPDLAAHLGCYVLIVVKKSM